MSLLSLDAGGAKRALVICRQLSSQTHRGVVFMTTDHRSERRIML